MSISNHPAYSQTIGDTDLQVTADAKRKITDLVQGTGGEAAAVRIYVSGGGCSGMNYGMTFAEQAEALDSTMNGGDGFQLVVDPVALGFLKGAEIDYDQSPACPAATVTVTSATPAIPATVPATPATSAPSPSGCGRNSKSRRCIKF